MNPRTILVTGGAGPDQLPDLKSTLDSVRARIVYHPSERLDAILQLRYERLPTDDWALEGIGPEDLNIAPLVERARSGGVREIVLATSATVDGQTTAHYVTERLKGCDIAVTRLAHGVPVGGELDYLDDGTLAAALKARRPF